MRRLVVLTVLAALVAPVAAYGSARSPGDGTLAVKNGKGAVALNVRGAVVGLVGQGRVEVEGPKDDDCDSLSIWGAERERVRLKPTAAADFTTVCVFAGKDVRFRLVGGPFVVVRLAGKDISLSAVGKGLVTLKGDGFGPDGVFSFNGGEFVSLPDEGRRFVLGSQGPPVPSITP